MDYINYVKQSPMSMGGMGGVVGSYNFRSAAGGGGATDLWDGGRVLMAGGANGAPNTSISYTGATDSGSASDFGELTLARLGFGGASNGERILWGSGQDSSGYNTSTIDYVTSSSTGNATDFGEDVANWGYTAVLSDSNKAVFGGGWNGSTRSNEMRYVTITTTGDASDFGDLINNGSAGGGCCNLTRGIFGLIKPQTGDHNIIQYMDPSTLGNATDFGNATQQRWGTGACCNSTRAVFGGGYTSGNTMDYVTIDTTGNASTFGTMGSGAGGVAGASDCSQPSNSGRGFFIGGEGGSSQIRYIDISSTGSSSSMGTFSGHGNGNYIAASSGAPS